MLSHSFAGMRNEIVSHYAMSIMLKKYANRAKMESLMLRLLLLNQDIFTVSVFPEMES